MSSFKYKSNDDIQNQPDIFTLLKRLTLKPQLAVWVDVIPVPKRPFFLQLFGRQFSGQDFPVEQVLWSNLRSGQFI